MQNPSSSGRAHSPAAAGGVVICFPGRAVSAAGVGRGDFGRGWRFFLKIGAAAKRYPAGWARCLSSFCPGDLPEAAEGGGFWGGEFREAADGGDSGEWEARQAEKDSRFQSGESPEVEIDSRFRGWESPEVAKDGRFQGLESPEVRQDA